MARPCTRAGCPARDGLSWSRRSRSAAARSPCTTCARVDSAQAHSAQLVVGSLLVERDRELVDEAGADSRRTAQCSENRCSPMTYRRVDCAYPKPAKGWSRKCVADFSELRRMTESSSAWITYHPELEHGAQIVTPHRCGKLIGLGPTTRMGQPTTF